MNARSITDRNYPAKYPELYQFFAGYFYQSWVSDYRWDTADPSFDAVVRHFRAVNPPRVVEAVRNQLEDLLSSTPGDDLGKALFELGNGFDPTVEGMSESEGLSSIAEVLSESAATAMVLRERY